MEYLTFNKLGENDTDSLCSLILDSPERYRRYFTPFIFEPLVIRNLILKAEKDKFFGIVLCNHHHKKLIAFYMLRGIDEGYPDPMYGIFVSNKYSSQGIAKLSMAHAECFCKINGYHKILLKVHPDNQRAKKVYEFLGFKYLKKNAKNENIIMFKNI